MYVSGKLHCLKSKEDPARLFVFDSTETILQLCKLHITDINTK